MNTLKKTVPALTALAIIVLIFSCASTGEYKPLANNETVIGTVQVTFATRSSFLSTKSGIDAVNTQAYIKLLEAAELKYTGNIDIRDIVWVTGRQPANDPASTEIFAAGKVIRGDSAADQ